MEQFIAAFLFLLLFIVHLRNSLKLSKVRVVSKNNVGTKNNRVWLRALNNYRNLIGFQYTKNKLVLENTNTEEILLVLQQNTFEDITTGL